jgi:hypothetical protein
VLEHGRPELVLEALTGVPLSAGQLRTTLTGCAGAGEPDWSAARQIGDDWRMVPQGADEVYLRRASRTGPWQVVAIVHRAGSHPEWRAEYRDFQNGLPRTLRLTSSGGRGFDLRLTLSQVDVNVPLDAGVFRVEIPASADPITVEELRESGPLGGAQADGR